MKTGLAFISTEPLKDYDERRIASAKPEKKDEKGDAKAVSKGDPKKAVDDEDKDGRGAKPDPGEGMMAGVIPGAAKKDDQKLLPVTPWGRYVKILLSSNEFIFIN
jgi:hypothetical protein